MRCARPGWSPRSSPGTRAPSSAPTSSSSPTACCPRWSRRSPRSPPPASSRSATCRRCRARRCGAPPARSAPRRCTSTRWTARCRSGRAATALRSTSTSSSSTAPAAAHVSISGISGVATKTSFALFLLYSIFQSGVLGKRSVNAKALVFSVKGEDLLFLDHPNSRLDGNLIADYAELGLPAGAVRVGGLLRAADPGRPERPPVRHRPHQRRHRVLVDARRVLLRRAAALRLRRRRGRAQPVHDGDPHGGGAPAAGGHAGRRRRGVDRRARSCAPTTRWSSSSPTGSPTRTPAATGRARSPAPAPSTRSCGDCARR